MKFLENKYRTIYLSLCANAKKRVYPNEYTERHHIIPKSLGGSNSSDNMVVLTGREHFIAHLLLVKITTGSDHHKMIRALVRMCGNNKNSKSYAIARKVISENSKGAKNAAYGKKWFYDPDTNLSVLVKPENAPSGWICGLPYQRGGVKRGSIWINNGENHAIIDGEAELPNGWVKGVLLVRSKEQYQAVTKARHTPEKDRAHSEALKGRITMTNGVIYRRIKPSEVANYLEQGWVKKAPLSKDQPPVIINGVCYDNSSTAAKALGLSSSRKVIYRVRSCNPLWDTWNWK